MNFEGKAAEDLEFDKIKKHVWYYCHTTSGKESALKMGMIPNVGKIIYELRCANEYLDSLTNIGIPGLQSGEILQELDILYSRHGVLHEELLGNIRNISNTVNYLIRFFIKNEELYPNLRQRTDKVFITKEIVDAINHVLDGKCIVKSSASDALSNIRKKLGVCRKQVEKNFQSELTRYRKEGWLDDTKESFVQGRRVLAVLSEYKRRISGSVLGSSATGKVTFIEPNVNVNLNNEIHILQQEERDEIHRILKLLTEELRQHIELIKAYQDILVDFDLVQAKARFARDINAKYPTITKKPKIELVEAYHPLLLIENNKRQETTNPQDIILDQEKRILVVSGPNAGGKSITLKTVGLLQMMVQSGLLIPVKEESKITLFQHILTDIGDNQSIENKLSTYSYRLQNMKFFLKRANARTLFLIDEFGTGSDPELGGALAEVFFEQLYESNAFGVITTHYSNIKVLADKFPATQNACMLFDKQSLEPLYRLAIGQPGSSFTFEVAYKNGIPHHLINEAKERVSEGKLKLDASIAALQKEKGKIEKLQKELKRSRQKADQASEDFEIRKDELEFKLIRLQQTQQDNNNYINFGKKFLDLINAYNGKNIKTTVANFVKYLKIEWTKKEEAKKKPKPKPTLAPIKKKREERKQKKEEGKIWVPVVVGDKVKMEGSSQAGEIVEIEKETATVNFGIFKTKVNTKKLFKV